MQVPLVDLTSQFQSIKAEAMSAIEGVLESGQLFLGPHTRAFEEEFAAYCGGWAASEVLSLPMYPELSKRQLTYVADALRDSVLAQPKAALG